MSERNEKVHETQSKIMKFLRFLGFESLAWSFRRIHCPVDKKALVLEVGSGGSPYFRSNVLCDAYEETQERFFTPLIKDRPTVIAFAEALPFKDDSFDFIIASHVLEHSDNPEVFLSELQRVAKAGYIEVPDAFMERLTHYGFHRLEITEKDGRLVIRKKRDYMHDPEVVDLFANKAKSIFPYWASKFPFNFHVRYYWSRDEGGIQYTIINPEVKIDWQIPDYPDDMTVDTSVVPRIKAFVLFLFRKICSQNKRNRLINLNEYLQCANCKGTNIKQDTESIANYCESCGEKITVFNLN